MRWAIKLSAYRYVIEHVSGDRNVWADMLSRWVVALSMRSGSKKSHCPIKHDPDLDWTSLAEIHKNQKK